MRVHKFRVWNKKENKMIYFDFKDILESDRGTGVKDKNGKEIYEGDILYIEFYARYLVVWDDCGYFSTECIEKRGIESFMLEPYLLIESEKENIEIIGNKYENPELLEN